MSEKRLMPEIRFYMFTKDWKQRKLGDLSDVKTGKAFSSANFNDGGEYLVITNKNIQDGTSGITPVGDRIDISEETTLNNYLLKGNNILVTMDGVNIGKTGKYSNEKAVLAQRVGRLNSEQIEFIYQVTKNNKFISEMNKLSVGNAIKHISLKQISDYSFAAPINEEEQEKIGTFFKQLDDTIVLQQQLLNDHKQLKKAMLQKMFPQKGESTPAVRFSGFTGEWKYQELIEFVGDSISDGDWIEKEHIHGLGEYRIIQTGNLGIGRYINKASSAKYINQQSFNQLKANEIYPGDILISRLADPAGRTIVLPYTSSRMVTAVDVAIIRPNNHFSVDFLVTRMNSIETLNEVSKQVSGTSHKRLSRKNLEKIKINIPNIDEQEKIGNFFKQLDETINLQQKKLESYQELKKAMLQKMFV